MSLHGDVNAERPSVPPEVQLKVAQCLLNEDIVPTPKQQSTFARLLTVSRTFLHVGLGQLYGHSSFEAYEESLTRLQQIRSSSWIIPHMKSVFINFDCVPYSWDKRAALHLGGTRFSQELLAPSTVGPKVEDLHVQWAHARRTGGQVSEAVQSSVEPNIYGATLLNLWSSLAPNLRTIRLDVYLDALPIVASIHGSLSPVLSSMDLRVHGGAWPDGVHPTLLEDALSAVCRSVIIEAAHTLERLELFLEPVGLNNRLRLSPSQFFKSLSTTLFPKMVSLGIQTGFKDGEEAHIANMVNNLVKQQTLTALSLKPCVSDYYRYEPGTPAYLAMLKSRGQWWSGLKQLSLYGQSETSQWGQPQPVVNSSMSYLTPILNANPTLQALHLDGCYVGFDELMSIVACLSPAHLHTLTIRMHVIRPSIFDALASSLPSLRTLHIRLEKTEADGPFIDSLALTIEHEEAVMNAIPHDDRQRIWKHQARIHKMRSEANERTFFAEMDRRRYDRWDLREASVVHDWSMGCVVQSPPAHAVNAANALRSSVPGLVLKEVRPKSWSKDRPRLDLSEDQLGVWKVAR